jgi:hypothetical protein
MERELREEGVEQLQREERRSSLLAHELRSYQRALTEQSESLAEERAKRMALELAAAETEPLLPAAPKPIESMDRLPTLATSKRERGWGRRFKCWLLGEKTG